MANRKKLLVQTKHTVDRLPFLPLGQRGYFAVGEIQERLRLYMLVYWRDSHPKNTMNAVPYSQVLMYAMIFALDWRKRTKWTNAYSYGHRTFYTWLRTRLRTSGAPPARE